MLLNYDAWVNGYFCFVGKLQKGVTYPHPTTFKDDCHIKGNRQVSIKKYPSQPQFFHLIGTLGANFLMIQK